MREWLRIEAMLHRLQQRGLRTLNNGARLICPVPHLAPLAYLHTLYRPLSEDAIADLERRLDKTVPKELAEFWRCSNGANLFSDSISIWGLRTSYERHFEARQPYDIVSMNSPGECPADAASQQIFLGFYNWDGSRLYMETDDPLQQVYRCSRDTVRPLNSWGSLWEMLEREVERLESHFDKEGREIDSTMPTIPEPEL